MTGVDVVVGVNVLIGWVDITSGAGVAEQAAITVISSPMTAIFNNRILGRSGLRRAELGFDILCTYAFNSDEFVTPIFTGHDFYFFF